MHLFAQIICSVLLAFSCAACLTTHKDEELEPYRLGASNKALKTRQDTCEAQGGSWKNERCSLPQSEAVTTKATTAASCLLQAGKSWDADRKLCVDADADEEKP